MKKSALLVLVIIIAVVFASCGQKTVDAPASNANDSGGDSSAARPVIVPLETGEVSIMLPEGWEVVLDEGTPVPMTEQTYNLNLIPPPGVKALCTVTVGKLEGGEPLDAEDFFKLVSSRILLILPDAVEDTADYKPAEVYDGDGVYCVLTDASLVGRELPADEYLYVAVFFANYKNGCLTYASLLTDDTDSESFENMLAAVTSIRARLG